MSKAGATLLRATYEYTAQYEEELTFPEGATIELVKMDTNGVDDGWWQGAYNGRVGVFPSVVVEVISNGTVSETIDTASMVKLGHFARGYAFFSLFSFRTPHLEMPLLSPR